MRSGLSVPPAVPPSSAAPPASHPSGSESSPLGPGVPPYSLHKPCTSAGVGFAIPSSTVLKIVPQLIQFGKVFQAGLNVDIAPDLIANQLNVRYGALVLQVPGNSLAAKAGLLPTTRGFAGKIILGDIIVAVDNLPVKNKAELYKALDDYNVGDQVTLKIQRGSENLELPVTLEEKSS
ncbi:Protease Do-like 8 [Morus notabilis]|uniref:Protease Do-like 8 n=1 Tax=Morus notabilis TaxID=981085 RepID=W9SGG7_9ROSA|nr:Protease Do-like 8 [Morus notabilis]